MIEIRARVIENIRSVDSPMMHLVTIRTLKGGTELRMHLTPGEATQFPEGSRVMINVEGQQYEPGSKTG